jgi:hypothetical protein
MAELEQIKDGVMITCDCNLIHKVKIKDGEIKLTTSGTMKKVEPEKPVKKEDSFISFFEGKEENKE